MSTNSRPRAIAMTHWAAEVDQLPVDRSGFISQLLLLSLLYDEVLIQDELLAASDTIAAWFTAEDGPDLWSEVLDIDGLTILRHPSHLYPPNLMELAVAAPMRARGRYIEQQGTKNDLPFTPSSQQVAFHLHTDACIALRSERMRDVGQARSLEVMPAFVQTLVSVLSRKEYETWLNINFSELGSNDRESFLALVLAPELLVSKLKAGGHLKNTIYSNDSVVFNRSLAYQATKLFPESKRAGLRRLIQTTFADPFCWRERAVGHFGELVKHVPLPTPLNRPKLNSLPGIIEIQASVSLSLALPNIRKGFSSAIGEVRRSQHGRDLRDSVSRLGKSSSMQFREQKELWGMVADDLAARLSLQPKTELSIHEISHRVLEGALVGAVIHTVQDAANGNPNILQSALSGAIGGAVHGFGGLTLDITADAAAQSEESHSLCAKLEGALEFSCIHVQGEKLFEIPSGAT